MRWERSEFPNDIEPGSMNYRLAACLVAAVGLVAVFGTGMLMMESPTMVEPSGLRVTPGATLTTCIPAGAAWVHDPVVLDESVAPTDVGTGQPLRCY